LWAFHPSRRFCSDHRRVVRINAADRADVSGVELLGALWGLGMCLHAFLSTVAESLLEEFAKNRPAARGFLSRQSPAGSASAHAASLPRLVVPVKLLMLRVPRRVRRLSGSSCQRGTVGARMPITYHRFAGGSLERLAALSDGVFAVAMTLLVLDLKAPSVSRRSQQAVWSGGGGSEHPLLHGLSHQVAPRLLPYAMSFLTLGIFWVGQQTQLSSFTRSTRALTWIHLCQWPFGSPHSWPCFLPTGGHLISPLVAIKSPRRAFGGHQISPPVGGGLVGVQVRGLTPLPAVAWASR
jgi:hypothetical protein